MQWLQKLVSQIATSPKNQPTEVDRDELEKVNVLKDGKSLPDRDEGAAPASDQAEPSSPSVENDTMKTAGAAQADLANAARFLARRGISRPHSDTELRQTEAALLTLETLGTPTQSDWEDQEQRPGSEPRRRRDTSDGPYRPTRVRRSLSGSAYDLVVDRWPLEHDIHQAKKGRRSRSYEPSEARQFSSLSMWLDDESNLPEPSRVMAAIADRLSDDFVLQGGDHNPSSDTRCLHGSAQPAASASSDDPVDGPSADSERRQARLNFAQGSSKSSIVIPGLGNYVAEITGVLDEARNSRQHSGPGRLFSAGESLQGGLPAEADSDERRSRSSSGAGTLARAMRGFGASESSNDGGSSRGTSTGGSRQPSPAGRRRVRPRPGSHPGGSMQGGGTPGAQVPGGRRSEGAEADFGTSHRDHRPSSGQRRQSRSRSRDDHHRRMPPPPPAPLVQPGDHSETPNARDAGHVESPHKRGPGAIDVEWEPSPGARRAGPGGRRRSVLSKLLPAKPGSKRVLKSRFSKSNSMLSVVPSEYRHLESLAALVPVRVIERLVKGGGGASSRPGFRAFTTDAALLFIDIGGFTSSMERFASQGTHGIEKFWDLINGYFNDLLNVIQQTGGDVDCFAGDALLVVYDSEKICRQANHSEWQATMRPEGPEVDKLATAALAAARCAGILLERLTPCVFEGKVEVQLTLHGSIGAGAVTVVELGGSVLEGVECWGTFVCGPVLEQLATAHDLSGKSEFALSPEVVAMVSPWVILEDLEGVQTSGCKFMRPLQGGALEDAAANSEGETSAAVARMAAFYRSDVGSADQTYRLELEPNDYAVLDDALPSYIPESVLQKFRGVLADDGANGTDMSWLGELRQASVGFVKFDTDSINSRHCHDRIQHIRVVTDAVIVAYREVEIAGGYVNKVIMDEKGLILLYAFGTPGCSYEMNNLHATRVAVEIYRACRRECNHRVGIGVASGQICCGLIGKSGFRVEYALAGDVVNLAARLSARADKGKEGVLCDQSTMVPLMSKANDALQGIGVKSVGRMRPKGKSFEIEVFQLSIKQGRWQPGMLTRGGCVSPAHKLPDLDKHEVEDDHRSAMVLGSRERELEMICDIVRNAQGNSITCCVLEGEAGMGKSLLLRNFRMVLAADTENALKALKDPQVDAAAAEGEEAIAEGRRPSLPPIHVIQARAAHLEQSTPYNVLSEVMQGFIALLVRPDSYGRVDSNELAGVLSQESKKLVPLLKYLNMPLQSEGSPRSWKRSLGSDHEERWRADTSPIGDGNHAHRGPGAFNLLNPQEYKFQRFQPPAKQQHNLFESPSPPHRRQSSEYLLDSSLQLSEDGAKDLVSRMKQEIPTEDKVFHSKTHRDCFTGEEAVRWMIQSGVVRGEEEALFLGRRLMELGYMDHMEGNRRFRNELLYYQFNLEQRSWQSASSLDEGSAKALAYKLSLDLEMKDREVKGRMYHQCFTGQEVVQWMLRERTAKCRLEALAILERLLNFGLIEPAQQDIERIKDSPTHLYRLKELALVTLPPTQIFELLQKLCIAIVRATLAETKGLKALVVVVDDLHWADAGSLHMVTALIKEGRDGGLGGSLSFLLSTRPAQSFPLHLRKKYTKLCGLHGITTKVALKPLSEEATMELACRLLMVDELDSELRRLIVTTCSGNPFFIEEMCHSLSDSGVLQTTVTSNGMGRAIMKKATANARAVPTSVQEIVSARIDTLDPGLALVLKVASVLGETFTFDLLAAVFPLDVGEKQLRQYLEQLMAGNFLRWSDDSSGHSSYRFAHALMSYTAYGMLLHSYRWRLHYSVAMVMLDMNSDSFMIHAHHWLQVAKGEPSPEEIRDLGGEEAFAEILHKAMSTILKAIQQLLGMGQFMDASIYFLEALDLIDSGHLPESPIRDVLEVNLLMQGCQLTQFMEGFTENLYKYAHRAYALCCREEGLVPMKQKVRAGLFMAQYEAMAGDVEKALPQLSELYEDAQGDICLQLEPAAIMAAVLVQRGRYEEARAYTAQLARWEEAERPTPLCLAMYEPVITLMAMNVVLDAIMTDDAQHQVWLNRLERYLKDSSASHRPFHLYASMSLFGTLYPVCVEYAEMVRFYHNVYRVVYHPQVLMPIRRGLLYQAPTAESRVLAENPIVTQGIEIMSLMCKIYESVAKGKLAQLKKARQALNELMSIVRQRPTVPTCAAVYQAARVLHEWGFAREILALWDKAFLRLSEEPEGGRGHNCIYNSLLPYFKGDLMVQDIEGGTGPDGEPKRASLEAWQRAADLFESSVVVARVTRHSLMEVRATTALARALAKELREPYIARAKLSALFEVYAELCPQPNYFAAMRLSALSDAMALNNELSKYIRDVEGEDDTTSKSSRLSDPDEIEGMAMLVRLSAIEGDSFVEEQPATEERLPSVPEDNAVQQGRHNDPYPRKGSDPFSSMGAASS